MRRDDLEYTIGKVVDRLRKAAPRTESAFVRDQIRIVIRDLRGVCSEPQKDTEPIDIFIC